jgi:hypothetical protein
MRAPPGIAVAKAIRTFAKYWNIEPSICIPYAFCDIRWPSVPNPSSSLYELRCLLPYITAEVPHQFSGVSDKLSPPSSLSSPLLDSPQVSYGHLMPAQTSKKLRFISQPCGCQCHAALLSNCVVRRQGELK